MLYKVGDKVRVKSLKWYNANRDREENINLIDTTDSQYNFIEPMSGFCGKIVTITGCSGNKGYYDVLEDNGEYFWTDEMFEGTIKEDEKMVSLDKVCEYLKSLTYQDYPGGPLERIVNDDIIQGLRKAVEE